VDNRTKATQLATKQDKQQKGTKHATQWTATFVMQRRTAWRFAFEKDASGLPKK